MYLTGTMLIKCSTTFVWGHPFSTYVSYDHFFNCPARIYSNAPPPSSHFICLRDFIDLIPSTPISTLLVCHSFLILLYPRNSRIDVFVSDTYHFLASYSVSSSLPWKALFDNPGFKLSVILAFIITDEA